MSNVKISTLGTRPLTVSVIHAHCHCVRQTHYKTQTA